MTQENTPKPVAPARKPKAGRKSSGNADNPIRQTKIEDYRGTYTKARQSMGRELATVRPSRANGRARRHAGKGLRKATA